MQRTDLPRSLTNAAFGAAVGVSERTIAGHRAARRLPLLPDGSLDLLAVLRLGYRAALEGRATELSAEARLPDLFRHLTGRGEIPFALAVREMAYRTPVLTAIFAVEAGATCTQAYRAFRSVQVATLGEAQDLMTEAGIPAPPGCGDWGETALWEPHRFHAPNWPNLARAAGEPHDEAAWDEAHRATNATRESEADHGLASVSIPAGTGLESPD